MIPLLFESPALAATIAGLFGLLVGSFINVVILRLPPRLEWEWRRECAEHLADCASRASPSTSGVSPESVVSAQDTSSPTESVSHEPAGGHEPGLVESTGVRPESVPVDLSPADSDDEVHASSRIDAVSGLERARLGCDQRPGCGDRTAESIDPEPPGIVFEPSHCPACGMRLKPWHNVPVLSWLALRGRCAGCGTRISAQYPAVELLTGVAFAMVVWQFGLGWQALAGLVFTGLLIAMSGIDARTTLLPDSLTLPLLWLGLLASTQGEADQGLFVPMDQAILGAVVGYLALWSVFWVFKLVTGKEGMGYGDFKLLAALGAWCGVAGLLPIVLISASLGAVVGSLWLAFKGRDHGTPIPFGPFLSFAGWVYLLWGGPIQALYLGLVQIG